MSNDAREHKTVTVSDQSKLDDILNQWSADGWKMENMTPPDPRGVIMVTFSRPKRTDGKMITG